MADKQASGFLISLDKDIDYKKIVCSMGKLQELMDVLGIKKHEVVKYYCANAVPIVNNFIICMGFNLESNSILSGSSPLANKPMQSDVMVTGPSDCIQSCNSNALASPSNTTPESSSVNIRTPCPMSKSNSKVEELRKGLQKSVNKMVSHGSHKSALVKLQSHLKDKASSSPENFTEATLQCCCPQLWIPINVAIGWPMLVALYNAFILEGDEPNLCLGVHYDIIPMKEMNFDGDISFPFVRIF
ncbi:hypothetical protein DFH28DRAFT_1085187 [Melampsora americana]|nr:hypothetical protein DFH28DRAFT_1085187 [Melampsora americana]